MTATAWAVAALVCGTVWGGFLILLTRAMRLEARKTPDER